MTPLSRRQEYALATRAAVLDSAQRLFVERGFNGTSLDDVATDARVTRGAVYHHFDGKNALFQAVLERVDAETMAAVVARAEHATTAWEAAIAGLEAYLDRCTDVTYRRICFEEGPTGMGFLSWWEHGERHFAGLLRTTLEAMRDEGALDLDDVDAAAALMFGVVNAAALTIVRADDPAEARDRVRDAAVRVLEGLRPGA